MATATKKNSKAAKKTLRTLAMRTTKAQHKVSITQWRKDAKKVKPARAGKKPAAKVTDAAPPHLPAPTTPKTGGKGRAAKLRDGAGDQPIIVSRPRPAWDSLDGARYMQIRVADICEAPGVVNGGRGPETPEEKAEIQGLADSIEQLGLIEPIVVHENKHGHTHKYTLIAGSRRWRAEKLRKSDVTDAKVFPNEASAQASTIRVVENVQRKDLNKAQECMEIARLVDEMQAELKGQNRDTEWFCKEIGKKIGKAPSFVRFRIYISRLGGQARELVASGRLPLGHAREIATLADPSIRDELALHVAAKEDGTGLVALERVRRYVAEHRFSLKTVAWDTNVEFAGKVACRGCDCNTMNDAQLYAHDAETNKVVQAANEKNGLCTNRACFEHKRKAAEDAIARGVKRVVNLNEKHEKGRGGTGMDIRPASLEELKLIPAGVRIPTFAAEVRKAVLTEPAAADQKPAALPEGGPRTAPAPKPKGPTAEEIADQKFAQCYAHYREETLARAIAALSASPGSLTQFAVMVVTGTGKKLLVPPYAAPSAYPEEDDRIAKVCQSPKTRELLRGLELAGAEKVAAMAEVEKQVGEFWHGRFQMLAPAALALAAEMCGAKDLPKRPVYEEILAEAKKEVAGGAKS